MKKTSIYILVAAIASGSAFSSCSPLVENNDISPNLPPDAPADQQLTATQIGEGFVMSGEAARTANIWAGVFTGEDRQYSALQVYVAGLPDFDNMWTNSYYLVLQQTRLIQEKARAVNNNYLLGIAQILEAQMIGTVTALWGDVPYSRAFVPGQPGPFDGQAAVYTATQALLDEAIANLGRNGINPGVRDIYYDGDLDKWRAAARSLKARYFLHAKNYAAAAAAARQGITETNNDMLMPYKGAIGVSANPYYDFQENSRPGYMAASQSYAAELMLSRRNSKTNDTKRHDFFFADGTLNTTNGAFADAASFPLISYVETQAILAEALVRGGDAAGALTALNATRTANGAVYGSSLADYTLADFEAGGLLNSSTPALSRNEALLKEILTEKYLSLVGQIEEFNDVRRTNNLIGVPKNVQSAPSLPQRFLVPQVEVNTNPNAPNPPPGIFVKTPVNQ